MKNRIFAFFDSRVLPIAAWLWSQVLVASCRAVNEYVLAPGWRFLDKWVVSPVLVPCWRFLYQWVVSPGLWLLWRLIAYAVLLLSFGRLDLTVKRPNKGAIARVWGFFGPFLVSREPWPITLPTSIPMPVPNGLKESFGWRKQATLAAYAALAGGLAYWGLGSDFAGAPELLGSWSHVILAAACVVSVLGVFTSLPNPSWKKGGLPLPATIRGWQVAGRELFTLPEMVKAWLLIGCVGICIYLVNRFAVEINQLNGDFMNSITSKDAPKFMEVLVQFGTVLAMYTVLGPMYTWFKQLLVLNFTMFTTRFIMRLYILSGNFYPVSLRQRPDNPNERIQQDVAAMCSTSLSFMYVIVDSLITFWLFGHILWDAETGLEYTIPFLGHHFVVHHLLLFILVGYALLGSNGVVRVGARLIGLQKDQKQLSANYRVGMVLFEKYAEPIAAYHGEEREYASLWRRFMLALSNNMAIIRWQRNLGFFTSGYGQISNLLPYAVLAPFYFKGQILFGTISRAVGAFGEILSSASVFVTSFSSLADLASSIERVGELRDALEELAVVEADGGNRVKTEAGELLNVEHMTLFTPDRGKVIVRDFNLDMVKGQHVAVIGPSGSGKTSILRAVAGLKLWDRGEGTIKVVNKPGGKLTLTQLAYLPSDATLREQILYPAASDVADEALLAVLLQVNLPDLAERVGGLDARYNWDSLSGGERQRLVIARALINKVALVIADEATSGLDPANEEKLYKDMMGAGITMLSVTHKATVVRFHDIVVELLGDGNGGWRTMPASESPLNE